MTQLRGTFNDTDIISRKRGVPGVAQSTTSVPSSSMTTFTLQIAYRLPASPVGGILEFSPAGKHLAIGDNIGRGIRIVDSTERSSIASFVATTEIPNSFVWDPIQPGKFVVGFVDGTFVSFAAGREEIRVHFLYERGAITTLALSNDSLVLAAAVGLHSVFVFRRKSFGGRHLSPPHPWRSLNDFPDKFVCEAEVISNSVAEDVLPIPRSLCFSFDGTLSVSYERHGLM